MFNNDSLDDTPIPDGCVSFKGGVYSDANPKEIGSDQAALMVNLDLELNGSVTTRRGCARIGTTYVEDGSGSSGGRWIQGLQPYISSTANFLMAVNKRFLWKNTGGSSWALVTGYAAGALAGHTQIHVEMVQGTDKMFLSDVFSNIKMWDGVTTFTDLGSGGATQPPFGCVSLAWHTNRLVASASSAFPTVVAFSDILDGTTWDTATQQIEPGSGDGEPVTGIFSWVDNNLIVFKRRSIWIVNCNPTLAVSDFTVQPIHKSIGVRAYRTAAQVGSDVFVLTTDGVRSIRRTLAVTSQQDVGPSISAPVDDIIRRINPSVPNLAHAIAWNHRYILFLPLDSSAYPNYALVYNTITQSWSGYWTGWDATHVATRVWSDGSNRMVFGDAHGYVKEWLDYVKTADEVHATYQDDGVEIPMQLDTRAMTFGDPSSPKTGLNYELEYAAKYLAPTVRTIDELGTLDTANAVGTLTGATIRKSLDLQTRGQFRELQGRVSNFGGKVTVKRFMATSFIDTIVLQS
jgi:hypothetical protein